MFRSENTYYYGPAIRPNQTIDKLGRCKPLDALHMFRYGKVILHCKTPSGTCNVITYKGCFTAQMTTIRVFPKKKSRLSTVCSVGVNCTKICLCYIQQLKVSNVIAITDRQFLIISQAILNPALIPA